MTIPSGSLPSDFFAMTDNVAGEVLTTANLGFQDITGYTEVSATISGSTLVIFAIGQSIGTNSNPTLFTPVNSLVQNLNPYDGKIYTAKDPLLGCNGTAGNYNTRLADKLITDGKFPRVIILPLAIGGTSVKDWTPAGTFNQRLRNGCLRIRQQGWLTNSNVKIAGIFDEGQADAQLGTSQAMWQSRFAEVRASAIGYGLDCKWFVPKDTMRSNTVNATIQAAQAAIVDNVKVFAGADTDSLTGANRQGDGTHLSDAGSAANAALWATVLEAAF